MEDKLLLHPDSPRLNGWIHRLLRQREKLLLFNQKYWEGLKRKEWLVQGDHNSKYFHHRAMATRKKQMILKLKDECGVRLDNKQDIAAKFISNYKARFTTLGRGRNLNLDVNLPNNGHRQYGIGEAPRNG